MKSRTARRRAWARYVSRLTAYHARHSLDGNGCGFTTSRGADRWYLRQATAAGGGWALAGVRRAAVRAVGRCFDVPERLLAQMPPVPPPAQMPSGWFGRWPPVCPCCGHRHAGRPCADHTWKDSCHYDAGADCVGPP